MSSFRKKSTVYFRRKLLGMIEQVRMSEHIFMILIAIVIGVLAGFGAVGIRFLVDEISKIGFGGEGKRLIDNIRQTPWYIVLLFPALGGLIIGPIIHRFAPEVRGTGVPEVMISVLQKGGFMRARVAIIKFIVSAICIGTGGSSGREGPVVQIGASIGSAIGQFVKLSQNRLKTLVACGAAAGIAAAFNAPIGGALFAVEIILMDFGFTQFSPIVISSVVATVISHQFGGNFATFLVPPYEPANYTDLINYLHLGVWCGVFAFIFLKTLNLTDRAFEVLPVPSYLKPFFGGLVVGCIALWRPEVMGFGYDSINEVLNNQMIWGIALILIYAKMFATATTLSSGGSGGIFAPSLFIGAMIGGVFGHLANQFSPLAVGTPGAYALVAMAGFVAATTHAPITAMIIVFELTNDYQIILPLMLVCIVGTIISSKLTRESVYTLRLFSRDVTVQKSSQINLLKSMYVRDNYSKDFETIPDKASFNEVVNVMVNKSDFYFFVVKEKSDLVGVISLANMRTFLFEGEDLQSVVIAWDMANQNFQKVTLGDSCHEALEKMKMDRAECLPVVDLIDSTQIIGQIRRKDILDAYQQEIETQDLASNLANRIFKRNQLQQSHVMDGFSIAEVHAPKQFWGKTLIESKIRRKYEVEILSIKQSRDEGRYVRIFPKAEYTIQPEDHLIIAGEEEKITVLQNLT